MKDIIEYFFLNNWVEDCNCENNKIKDYSKSTFNVYLSNLASTLVTIYGDMFQYTTLNGLYLSSSNTSIPSLTTLNLYSKIKSISGRYPAITVFPVKDYNVVENYILQFELPSDLPVGNYDIIYFNDAGYFKASSTKRFTYFTIMTSFPLNNWWKTISESIDDLRIKINLKNKFYI